MTFIPPAPELSVAEAALLLGLSVSRTRSLVNEGKLAARRFEGRWRIRQSTVLDYLEQNDTRTIVGAEPTAEEIAAIPPNAKQKCKNEHWMVERNVYRQGNKRRCRTCMAGWTKNYQAKQRSA